ncbi:MAG TPA: alpha/beta fold hydrolase [Longimicrobiales bacterium]|nr:alpha/beta fold hydrolase [Longimicrobiales bacterium]
MNRAATMPAAPPAVLLVPGWSDSERALRPLARRLRAAGWPPSHVRTLGFRRRFGGNVEHAEEIAAAVDALRAAARCPRVALVAHSMGGLAARWYLTRLGGAAHVHTAIFLATPHHGTYAAWLGFGPGAREMRPGSEFLQRLNATPWPDTVRAHCFRTPLDLRIFPPASALLDGATARVIRAPTHPGMLRSRPVFRALLEALRSG